MKQLSKKISLFLCVGMSTLLVGCGQNLSTGSLTLEETYDTFLDQMTASSLLDNSLNDTSSTTSSVSSTSLDISHSLLSGTIDFDVNGAVWLDTVQSAQDILLDIDLNQPLWGGIATSATLSLINDGPSTMYLKMEDFVFEPSGQVASLLAGGTTVTSFVEPYLNQWMRFNEPGMIADSSADLHQDLVSVSRDLLTALENNYIFVLDEEREVTGSSYPVILDQDTVKEFARELLHNDYILSLAGFENIDDISDEEMDTFVEDFVVYFDSLDISFDLDGDIVVLHAVSAEGTPAFTNFALSSETSSLDMKLDEVADVSIVVENTVSSSPDYTLTLVESGDMLIEIVGSMTKNADELLIDGTIEVVSAVFAPLVGGDLTPDENMIITYSIVETSADASLDVLVIPTSDEYVLAEDIESGLGSIVSFE